MHEGCDYDVVVLYHCKHTKGNSIFPYATPGKAFEFLGDGSKDHPPSDEGRFLGVWKSRNPESGTGAGNGNGNGTGTGTGT